MSKKAIASGKAFLKDVANDLLNFGKEKGFFNVPESIPFDRFLKNQVVVDHIQGNEIVKWYKTVRQEGGEDICVLARPTCSTMDLFHIEYDSVRETIDTETNLLQFVFDRKSGKISHVRLISFCTMSCEVSESLKSSDYIFLEE